MAQIYIYTYIHIPSLCAYIETKRQTEGQANKGCSVIVKHIVKHILRPPYQ